jgi:hypothetical protein
MVFMGESMASSRLVEFSSTAKLCWFGGHDTVVRELEKRSHFA